MNSNNARIRALCDCLSRAGVSIDGALAAECIKTIDGHSGGSLGQYPRRSENRATVLVGAPGSGISAFFDGAVLVAQQRPGWSVVNLDDDGVISVRPAEWLERCLTEIDQSERGHLLLAARDFGLFARKQPSGFRQLLEKALHEKDADLLLSEQSEQHLAAATQLLSAIGMPEFDEIRGWGGGGMTIKRGSFAEEYARREKRKLGETVS